MLDLPHLDDPRQQQAGKEGIKQAGQPDTHLRRRQGPAADHIAVRPRDAIMDQRATEDEHAQGQHQLRELAHEQRIQDVADIFVEQGPARPDQRMHFPPATDIERGADRDQGHADDHHHQQQPYRGFLDIRENRAALEIEHDGADDHRHDDHRMQANQPALEEFGGRHRLPAVVVGIADDEAGQDEKEIHRQVAMVDDLDKPAGRVGLEQVEGHDDEGGHAAQTIENRVMAFRVCKTDRREVVRQRGLLKAIELFRTSWGGYRFLLWTGDVFVRDPSFSRVP